MKNVDLGISVEIYKMAIFSYTVKTAVPAQSLKVAIAQPYTAEENHVHLKKSEKYQKNSAIPEGTGYTSSNSMSSNLFVINDMKQMIDIKAFYCSREKQRPLNVTLKLLCSLTVLTASISVVGHLVIIQVLSFVFSWGSRIN